MALAVRAAAATSTATTVAAVTIAACAPTTFQNLYSDSDILLTLCKPLYLHI